MPSVHTRINGAQHYEGAQTKLNTLRRDQRVDLVRYPDNPHDPNAIKCVVDGVFLGYVRAKDAKHPAAAMDRGGAVTCRIFPNQPMIVVQWPSVVGQDPSLRRIVRA